MMRSPATLNTNSLSAPSDDESHENKSPDTSHHSRSRHKKKRTQRSKSVGHSTARCLVLFKSSHHPKKRKRSEYDENYSAALALPSSTEELETLKDHSIALPEITKNFIVEHASRRVDLFFYTLVAYYNSRLSPIQGRTSLQHGKGRNADDKTNITQACHSSFLPALIDETINKRFANHQKYNSILSGTHFSDSLNSTVELPIVVNEFDDELENKQFCRKKSIDILNQVSMGKINPIEGLNHFMQMMALTLINVAAKMQTSGTLFSRTHEVDTELLQLVKEGTFAKIFSEDSQTATHEYIESLLRLKPDEINACKQNEKKREKIYLKKIQELQAEVLNTESNYDSPTYA
jgi:hypothetical protein